MSFDMLRRVAPCGTALMACSTEACGGNSTFGGAAAAGGAAAGALAGVAAGVAAVGAGSGMSADAAACGEGAFSAGGEEAAPPPQETIRSAIGRKFSAFMRAEVTDLAP